MADQLYDFAGPGEIDMGEEQEFLPSAVSVFETDPDAPVVVDLMGGALMLAEPGEEDDDDDGYDRAPVIEEHDRNLAEEIDETSLVRIAQSVCEYVESDLASRKPWEEVYRKGLELLGIAPEIDDGPFPGCSTATYPLIAEAVVQFNARALQELFPSDGPVKGVVYGQQTEDALAAADRVQGYMNYQMIEEDPSYFDELDQMLFYLPLAGSAFKKTYYDHVQDMLGSCMIRGEDFIVPYSATSLEKAPRYTHRFHMTANELRKSQVRGLYRDIEIAEPSRPEEPESVQVEKAAVGQTDERHDDDVEHTIYEQAVDLDLQGFEDTDESGRPTGIALPYLVTVERDSQKVLAIRRNWRHDDAMKRRRDYVTHYKFLPGLGFYGFGFPHLIGGLARAATGAVRAILDGAATASIPGGFKAKEAGLKGGELIYEPGKYKDVDLTAEELRNAFFSPPVREPSAALFSVLGTLIDAGRRFASITETMVGDADNKGPVGTTVALIEQGSKVFSAIHKRLHKAAAHEFGIRYDLNAEYVPEEGYPYLVEGDEREIFKSDFSERIRIRPVSDPNIFSETQRIAVAQAGLDLANSAPDLHDRQVAMRRMHEALKTPDIDSIMPKKADVPPMDPVSENQAILMQRPVKAFLEQDHEAHIAAHLAFMQHPEYGGHPQARELVMPAMLAHLAEHAAHLYRIRMAEAGVPTPETNYDAGPGEPFAQPIGPQEQDMVAAMAAQVSPQFMEQRGVPAPQQENGQDQRAAIDMAKVEAAKEKNAGDLQVRMAKIQSDERIAAEDRMAEMVRGMSDQEVRLAEVAIRARHAAAAEAKVGIRNEDQMQRAALQDGTLGIEVRRADDAPPPANQGQE